MNSPIDGQEEFDFDPRRKFRSSDPITSRLAAFENLPLKDTQRRALLDIHLAHPLGLTNDELDTLSAIALNSLTTRVSELSRGGWLEDSGLTRPTRNGIHAVVWRVTQKAKQQSLCSLNP
jgi:hypothetical protein